MPKTPGMFWLPNSAQDSLAPKNLNFVFAPGQTALLDVGEDAVVVEVGVLEVEAPGWHCE